MTQAPTDDGVDRRTLLRRGAFVGAAVWAAPVVQVVGMTAASASDPSGGGGGGGGGGHDPDPDPEDPPAGGSLLGKVPSHAVLLVTYAGTLFGVKLDGTDFDKVASPSDVALLVGKGFTRTVTSGGSGLRAPEPVKDVRTDVTKGKDGKSGGPAKVPHPPVTEVVPSWSDPSSSLLAVLRGTAGPGADAGGHRALVVRLPAGVTYVAGSGFVFDGGLQSCRDGDKYQPVELSGGALYFYGECH